MNIFVAISFFFLIANFEGNLELEFDVEKQHVLLRLLLYFIKFSFRKVVLFFSYFQQHWVLFFFSSLLIWEARKWMVCYFILHFFDYQWIELFNVYWPFISIL